MLRTCRSVAQELRDGYRSPSPVTMETGGLVGGKSDGGTSGHYALYRAFLLENGPATPKSIPACVMGKEKSFGKGSYLK